MAVSWSPPAISFGFVLALVVLLVAVILTVMHLMDLTACLVVASICATRL
jgi:hypothetical protein